MEARVADHPLARFNGQRLDTDVHLGDAIFVDGRGAQ